MSCHQGAEERVFFDFADGLLVAFCNIRTRVEFGPIDLIDSGLAYVTQFCGCSLEKERGNLRRACHSSR